MNRRQVLAFAALLPVLPATSRVARAASPGPMPVVASFSILADMVAQVGGARVAVTSLVGRDGDAHVYRPTPADARAVAQARLVFVNGLGFEGWMERLAEAAGDTGPVIVASAGASLIRSGAAAEAVPEPEADHDHDHDHAGDDHATDDGHAAHGHDDDHAAAATDDHATDDHAGDDHGHGHHHGDWDPHAWHSLANAAVYVRNIAAALAEADPEGAAHYSARRDAYLAEMARLDTELRAMVADLPAERRLLVTAHDAFAYLGRDYGLTFLAAQGVSTESEASAADVARLIRQVRDNRVPAIFLENVTDPRLLDRIRQETGAAIGGTLYSGALSSPDGPAPTYLEMMRHNVRTITQALAA